MATHKLPLDSIIHGDNITELEKLPAESVDLVFADPPYNLQLQQDLWRPNRTKVDAVNDAWDKFDDLRAYDEFTRAWLTACRRVLKPNGALWVIGSYHNIYRVGTILQDLDYWILNDVVWVKTNPMPNFRGVRFTNAHETLLWVQKEKGAPYTFNHHAMKALNGEKQMRSDWIIPICNGSERLKVNGEKAHSTQKPEALLYRVIQSTTNPGDVVLDPFFGSGTTGAVAKRLHRHWIGIEREEAYVQLARGRIDAVEADAFEEETYVTPDPRKQPRVPFGKLLESGLVAPGQKLYLGEKGRYTATVLADGAIKVKETRGSIHQVAKQILDAPANGWDVWFYQEKGNKRRKSINDLRQQYREEFLV